MCQAVGNIFFERCIGSQLKLHIVTSIVIFQNLNQRFFLEDRAAIVINAGIKQRSNFQTPHFFEKPVILNRLRDTAGRKNRMELASVAECDPVIQNIGYYHTPMFFPLILGIGQIIFNALQVGPVRLNNTSHGHAGMIHIAQIDFFLFRVAHGCRFIWRLGLFEGNCFTQIAILIGRHHIRVKPQNIFVPDTVCNTVPVQLISKHIGSRAHFLLIFVMDWCPCKSEEHGIGKGFLDCSQHLAEHVPVRFVNDENNPLIPN